MTLKVRICHAQPGYPKALHVQPVNPDSGAPSGEARVVTDGQDTALYVHSGCALLITEVDVPLTPNGGGGPGEEKNK